MHRTSTVQIQAVIKHRVSSTPQIPLQHILQSFLAKSNNSSDVYNPQVKMNAAFRIPSLHQRREITANATQWPQTEQHNKLYE
jgi:hypothetical protein